MDRGTTPVRYRALFIEPGIISYDDIGAGHVLVLRPALDKMLQSFMGKPVFNVSHNDTSAKTAFDFSNLTDDEKDNLACGVISAVGFDDASGWYWADMMIWDAATQANIDKNGFTVSCAYIPGEDTDATGGTYHGIHFDEEVLSGAYTHMAVVDNPRYEGARVFRNSKEGDVKITFFPKKNAKKNAEDDDAKKADDVKAKAGEDAKKDNAKKNDEDGETMNASDMFANIDGEQVPVSEMVQSYMKKRDKKNAEDKAVSMDDEVELPDGTKCTVGDLVKDYKASKKNADVTTEPTGTDAEEVVDEAKQKQNARAKPTEEFITLRNAAAARTEHQRTDVLTRHDRLSAGKSRYGTVVEHVKAEV